MPHPITNRPPYVSPSSPKTSPGGTVELKVWNGSGSGYVFSVWDNKSGGSLLTTSSNSATWTAGSVPGLDSIQVVDGYGNRVTRDIEVLEDGRTLATLRADAKDRCDMKNDQIVSDAEWNKWINGGYYELYDRLVTAYDNDYNLADPYPFMTDGITERYVLPPDFYKLTGVAVQVGGLQAGWLSVPRVNFPERNRYSVPFQLYYGIRTNLHYRLAGKFLWLLPLPAAGQWMRLHFVPRMTPLVADTDVVDGVSGWEEYIIAHACMNARIKQELDANDFRQVKADMAGRIDAIAESRDIANPGTITDTRGTDDGGFNSGQGFI